MKYTEGAFKDWGYQLARDEFADVTITEQELWDSHGGEVPAGRVVVKDRIADAMFQQVLLRLARLTSSATPLSPIPPVPTPTEAHPPRRRSDHRARVRTPGAILAAPKLCG